MSWLVIRQPLEPHRALFLKFCAFSLPLGLWCVISYVPWIWHPEVLLVERGGTKNFVVGGQIPKAAFQTEQTRLAAAGLPPMVGKPVNPIFVPPPHKIGRALIDAFTKVPDRKTDPRMYQRVWQSVCVLAMGFGLACVVALPVGIICGTYDFFSKLIEPFIDFMRYMPAPAFGALAVALFGLADAPKVSIIFIGLFFNMLLVAANTTRSLDVALLEAAQTLGARGLSLLTRVVIPGSLPTLYTDLRIALGFGWVYLTIAELQGGMSGITEFANQNGKFRNYPNAFAAIFILGILGFITDQLLGWLGRKLFPWQLRSKSRRAKRAPKSTAQIVPIVTAPETLARGVTHANS